MNPENNDNLEIKEPRGPYYKKIMGYYNELVKGQTEEFEIYFDRFQEIYSQGRILTRIRIIEGMLLLIRYQYKAYEKWKKEKEERVSLPVSPNSVTMTDNELNETISALRNNLLKIFEWLTDNLAVEEEEKVLTAYALFNKTLDQRFSKEEDEFILEQLNQLHEKMSENNIFTKLEQSIY